MTHFLGNHYPVAFTKLLGREWLREWVNFKWFHVSEVPWNTTVFSHLKKFFDCPPPFYQLSAIFDEKNQFSSVAQSCPTLCDPMDNSSPGLPVHHQLPKFTQTRVHWVSDAIEPSSISSSVIPFSHHKNSTYTYFAPQIPFPWLLINVLICLKILIENIWIYSMIF